MSAIQTRAVNALSRTKHICSGNAVADFRRTAEFKKVAALILSYALLCCATQPMLLAQEPQPPIVSTAPIVKAPKPTRQASPKQLEKARNLFTKGTEALKKEDAERALTLLGEAHQLVPENAQYLAGYEIAKQQQVAKLLHAAEKQQISGTPDAALGMLHLAHMLDPNSPFVREHMQPISEQSSATVQRTPLPELASGIIPLDAKATALSFHFRANAHDLIHRVFDAYGITTLLDESVPDSSVRLDMDSVSFDAASKAVQLVTNTFVVPLDAHRVLVAKDTRENREKFERLLLETIYLPGLSEKQMTDATNLVKNVFGVKQVSIQRENSRMSIRAPESTLRAINLTMAGLYQGKPEVLLDVRAYQVSYSRAMNLGPQLPQVFTVFNVSTEIQGLIKNNQSLINQLISSGLVNPGDYAAIAALLVYYGLASGSILSQPFALFGNGLTLSGLTFGSASMNASLNVSSAKQLDQVQLRASNQQTASFLVGSRYPIITQSYSGAPSTPNIPGLAGAPGLGGFSGLGTNSTSSSTSALATTPQVQYENLGLTVKVTPQILRDHRVDLQLDVKMEALAGTSVNDIPILNSRAFVSNVEIRDGDSALLVSNMTRQEENSISGIPGLSELPGMSWTGEKTTQVTVGDLVLVVTPHIISMSPTAVASGMISVPSNQH